MSKESHVEGQALASVAHTLRISDGGRVAERDLEGIYRSYGPAIYRRCRLLLADEAEAHDALHDIFLILHGKLSGFRGEADPMTWIYRIATNHCLNRLRSRNTRRRWAEQRPAQTFTDPTEAFERRELLEQILAQLSPRQAQISVHRYIDEMTQTEIAQVLGISERTVRSELRTIEERVRHSVERLTQLLEAP